MKKLILILLVGIFTSCESTEICESECYNIVNLETIDGFDYYTLVNECTQSVNIIKTDVKEPQYNGVSFEVGNTICGMNLFY